MTRRLQILETRCIVLRMLVFIWSLCLLVRVYKNVGRSVLPPTYLRVIGKLFNCCITRSRGGPGHGTLR